MLTHIMFIQFQNERHTYNWRMSRSALRLFSILGLLVLAVFVPVIASGYFELKKAITSDSHVEAAQHYQNAARRLPWRADLYELSGHAYYYAKDYEEADAVYQKASQRRALSPEGWVAWGDVHYVMDDPQRAAEIWEQALEQKDPSDHLYSRLAQIHQSNGDYPKAMQYLQKYVSAHSDEASAHYRLGLLLTLSDSKRALLELAESAQIDPQFGPAVQTLTSALTQAPSDHTTSARMVIIGRGLGLVNEWQLAHAAFESAVELDEKNAEAWAWLGEANQHTGSSGGGSAELDQALELDPNSPIVRGLRGLNFQRSGNFRQALVEFQFASALEPNNPTWYVSIGESQSKLGDLIRALEAYQTATVLAPEDPSYWHLLAIFCGQNNVNIRDVGVPAAQRAVLLADADVSSLDILGWLLTLDARYDEAEQMLSRALEMDTQNVSVHLHLGMLYMQTDDRDSARDHFIQARDLGSNEAELYLKQYFP
jgi:tetratricopeptide (TPR) repeat protein